MRTFFTFLTTLILFISCSTSQEPQVKISGLEQPVEIIRDKWGINHIYAENQHDLFFAQGYAAAKDRLFQFEIWRRQATGTVAELLGPKELKRDIGTRLFKYRGDLTEEFNYYHEDGVAIIQAYVDGVNAYIEEAVASDNLPVEFQILGTKPQKWTPEVVISRHQGLLGNIGQELNFGRAVAKVGADKVRSLAWFHPKDPILELDPAIDGDLLEADILELYNAYRRPVRFQKEDLAMGYGDEATNIASLEEGLPGKVKPLDDWSAIGSNNWVVSGSKTQSGHTIMANDPHRTIAVPSLRYMAHLVAPGWNVIGGGEPEIPGISIGHNEYGAWGLTVFRTDGEDLYVYDLNPENLNQYQYKGEWENMEVISESIPVKGEEEVVTELRYSRHGPITYIDSANLKAYAIRCAWLEPGGAPYLASLRMDQATSWEEFREGCSYSNIPGENMVWAGKDGTIGWQSVGIAPIRNNFSGLVPVPGDGRYEWDGYLPILDKPNSLNPELGYIATANQSVTPQEYEHWNAIGYSWSDPFRGSRVEEVLNTEALLSMEQMQSLQTDYLSIPARILTPYLKNVSFEAEKDIAAQGLLDGWDYRLEAESIPAAIYAAWEDELRIQSKERFLPEEIKGLVDIQLKKIIDWIENPDPVFGSTEERDNFIRTTFIGGLEKLNVRLGPDMTKWQYGQTNNKHIYINHALGGVATEGQKAELNIGPMPRGGNGYTPGSTSSSLNQASGASFRMIVNTGNWDEAVGTNAPGQSGDPGSKFYNNLFESWVKDEYFPVLYSREKVENAAVEKLKLMPKE
ncbi:MAG: penicillin acylase family protein [Bacteroidetes bacterium]|nr:MAG: penicillin acylase family protein [Bacteroidota bacterium]